MTNRFYAYAALMLAALPLTADEVTFDFVENTYSSVLWRAVDEGAPTRRAASLVMEESPVVISFQSIAANNNNNGKIGFNQNGMFLGTLSDFVGEFTISADGYKITGVEIAKYKKGTCQIKINDQNIADVDNIFTWSGVENSVVMLTASGISAGVLSYIKISYADAQDIPDPDPEPADLPVSLNVKAGEIPADKIEMIYVAPENTASGLPEFDISIYTDPTEMTVSVDVPDGWDAIYSLMLPDVDTQNDENPEYQPAMASRISKWAPVSDLEDSGYRNGNTFDVFAYEPVTYDAYLAKEGKYDEKSRFIMKFSVNEDTGVSAMVSSEDSAAEYYNLQGVKIADPIAGEIYIRVKSGKAEKILRK